MKFKSMDLSSVLLLASGLVVVINWMVLGRDEFRSRLCHWREAVKNQLRRGGSVALVFMVLLYVWTNAFHGIIQLFAAFWLLGMVLKAFSNEGKLSQNKGVPQPSPIPQAQPQPAQRPVNVNPTVQQNRFGAIPRGPIPPTPVYPDRPRGRRVFATIAVIAIIATFFTMIAATNVTPRRMVAFSNGEFQVSSDSDWDEELNEVFHGQRNQSSRGRQIQIGPSTVTKEEQSHSNKDKSRSTKNRNKKLEQKVKPPVESTPVAPPTANRTPQPPAPLPAKPESSAATQLAKTPHEPLKNQIKVNEIVGERLSALGTDKGVTIYGESESSAKEAMNDVFQRVSDGLVHYLKVEHEGLQLGDWKPKPFLINQIMKYSKTEEQPTKNAEGKSVYVSRIDLEMTPYIKSEVYKDYLKERAPSRVAFLGKLYAGFVFMTGGIGVMLRLGTSKRVPQSTLRTPV